MDKYGADFSIEDLEKQKNKTKDAKDLLNWKKKEKNARFNSREQQSRFSGFSGQDN
ncbi:MAG: hypothetical protein ACLFUH_09285 [Bacteroidales bacterium]